MLHSRKLARQLSICALALLLATALPAGSQARAPWPQASYSQYAEDQSLADVLRQFAGGFSLALQLGPGIQGTVNGRFNTATPTEFLDRLGGVYGFNWFVHAGTLYVSRASDVRTVSVRSLDGSIENLRNALSRVGVLDNRFGWGDLPDQGVALVSGPDAYVRLIQRTISALPIHNGGQQVVVFRLRHATVNDRVVNYRGKEITTPGLETILRQLIMGQRQGDEALSSIAAPLRTNPPEFAETDGGVAEALEAVTASDSGRRSQSPTIQADTRLNAIIVQDIPSRIPIYQALIEQLDIPSTLIEIEAMIVDVNADTARDLGVNWASLNGNVASGYGDLGLSPSDGLPISAAASGVATPGLIGLSVGNTLSARLRALASQGEASILSQPSILTGDNLEALIDLSETFYIQSTGERVATVTPVTVGTSLRVTPRYISSGPEGPKVELTVDIEDGTIQNTEIEQVGGLPRVRKSNISTLAVVGDSQTLLIGGYNSTQQSEQVNKVPVLGEIPGLGVLFSNRTKAWQRRERLFLIRPRVVAIDGLSVVPVLNPEEQARQDQEVMDAIKRDRQATQRRQDQMRPALVSPPDPALGKFEKPEHKNRDWWSVTRNDPDYWDSPFYR